MASSKPITRRAFLAGASLALGACATAGRRGRPAAERPNLLVLVTDDQRWDAMGCAGNPIIQTPNMDALAARGTRFANAFATTAICMASRASILTGLYTGAHRIDDFNAPLPAPLFARTYPAVLRRAGYYTGFIGKWGIGGALPVDEFDFFDGFSGQGQYFQQINGETVHLTRILGDKTVDFIRRAPPDRPFCLSVSFKAPHQQDEDPRQYLYDPALEDLYRDVTIPVPELNHPRYFEALPEFVRISEGRKRWEIRFATPEAYQRSVKGYYRLVTGVDIALGRVLRAIEEAGLAGNTVIVFASDHGCFLGERGLADKWLMYEPSIRMPLIILDPRVPARRRKPVRDEMALNIDLAPTLLDLAGVAPPPAMQGRSLAPLLEKGRAPWRKEWYYEHHFGNDRPAPIPATEGVRTERWKYFRYAGREPLHEELYDLRRDPFETENLAKRPEYQAMLARLRERWRIWRDAVESWDGAEGRSGKDTIELDQARHTTSF